jgi:hypothetical protein
LKKAVLIAIFLLSANLYPVFGSFGEPTSQEQKLYNTLLTEFEKLTISKDVSDTLKSFNEPITISFPCDLTDENSSVDVTITTKLARFDDSLASHEGTTTGGIYVWKCSITFSQGKLTINCDNGLMLNSDVAATTAEKDPQIKQAEDLVIFYHELLHGQLMIDAIKSSDAWRNDACNKKFQEDLDYSYSDADHKIITPLQTEFASHLIENIGGIFEVEEINPSETTNGAFNKKIGNLYDYPEYVKSGISISARSYNVVDIEIVSQENDIMISGYLNNKSQPGIIWLYIFGRESPDDTSIIETQNQPTPTEETEIPYWIKNNAKWWAEEKITDTDFVLGIQHLINEEIIKIPQTIQGAQNTQQIPYWIKNNAKWWASEVITDTDFVQGIQYLIRNGIMQIQLASNQPSQSVTSNSETENLGVVRVNSAIFEKQLNQSTQVQITGEVKSYKTGTNVILTITKPDQSSYELKGILTNKGQFTIPVMMDANAPLGKYVITAKYNSVEFGTTSFILK